MTQAPWGCGGVQLILDPSLTPAQLLALNPQSSISPTSQEWLAHRVGTAGFLGKVAVSLV